MKSPVASVSASKPDLSVYFLISCVKGENSGAGGHYHSLKILIENLKNATAHIIVLGDFMPLALEGMERVALLARKSTSIGQFSEVLIETRLKNVIIHAYDLKAGAWAVKPSWILNVPLIVTKAGGKPQPIFVPRFPNMIYFQRSEYIAETSFSFFRSTIEWIPHRVSHKPSGEKGAIDPFHQSSPHVIKILRICRIGKVYEHSVLATFNLARSLREKGQSVEVVVIGKVEDSSVLRRIEQAAPSATSILTSANWHNYASQFIQYSDVVVGTGRSFMEGMRENKIMCVPAYCAEEPILVDQENFTEAFAYNFSPRLPISCHKYAENNSARIMRFFKDGDARKKYEKFCQKAFEDYFDIEKGIAKISALYSCVKPLTYSQYVFFSRWAAAYLIASRLKKVLQRVYGRCVAN